MAATTTTTTTTTTRLLPLLLLLLLLLQQLPTTTSTTTIPTTTTTTTTTINTTTTNATTEEIAADSTHFQLDDANPTVEPRVRDEIETCIHGAVKDEQNLAETAADLANITDFGISLFKELFPYNTTERNFFFSPYSVWSALTLAYFGSAGETERQLQSALRVSDKLSAMKSWRSLEFQYSVLQTNNSGYTLNVANKAYFDNSVDLQPCISKMLPSELERIDFTQPDAAADTINAFVSNTTKNRITNLVDAALVSGARMVLANAAFFKGVWLSQFKASDTKKELFYSTMEEYVFVDMMHQKGNFRYGLSEELGAHILELPYTGESISLYILLPPFISGENGFTSLVESLNGPLLHHALSNTWRTEMEVVVPKFKLEELIEGELIDALKGLGVTDLFDGQRADLSVFTKGEKLSVDKSVHRAFVEVNEEGTEAAAATALISWRIARPVGPTKFEAKHPFLFVIYDNLARNVLFLGAYKNPRAA